MPTSVASGTSAGADAGRPIFTVTSATTASPIVATTATHSLTTANKVTVARIITAALPVLNIEGYFPAITVPLGTTIGLTGSIGVGTYAASTVSLSAEVDLATNTTNKTYVLVVDAGAMGDVDILELRLYAIALTAGTERMVYSRTVMDIQPDPIIISPPVVADISIRATLCQPAGTARSFPWKLLSL